MLNLARQEKAVLLFIFSAVFFGICISYLSKSNPTFKKFFSDNFDFSQNTVININKADLKVLTRLPGIGAGLAGRILEYRKEHGNFTRLEEVKNVKGIGGKKYELFKDYISVE